MANIKYTNYNSELHEVDGLEVSCLLCGDELELTEIVKPGNHQIYEIAECTCDEYLDYVDVQDQINILQGQIDALQRSKPLPNASAKNLKRYNKELERLKEKYNQP